MKIYKNHPIITSKGGVLVPGADYFVSSSNTSSYSGSGATMNDLTGNYGVTNLINGITFNPTTKGLVLNGTNQYIQSPVNHIIQTAEDFTYMCTFKTAQTNGALLISNYGNSGGGTQPAANMYVLATSGYYSSFLRNYGGTKSANLPTTTAINDNTKHNAAITKVGNVYSAFSDGVFLGSVTSDVSPIVFTSNIVFGVLNYFLNQSWFNGEFYNMMIYKTKGLTPTEVNHNSQILLSA